jgi:hypothetical protein
MNCEQTTALPDALGPIVRDYLRLRGFNCSRDSEPPLDDEVQRGVQPKSRLSLISFATAGGTLSTQPVSPA